MSEKSPEKETSPDVKKTKKDALALDDFITWLAKETPSAQKDLSEARSFTPTKTSSLKPTQEVKKESNLTIKKITPMEFIKGVDYVSKIFFRFVFIVFFSSLLIYQNTTVFNLITSSLKAGNMDKLQLVFSTLIAGTLTETYLIVKIMVEWVFSDNKYPEKIKYEK